MADENRVQNEKPNAEKRPVLEAATTLTGKRKKHHPALIWLSSIACVALLCGAGYWAATELKPEEVVPEATEAPDYTTKLIEHTTDEVKSTTVTYGGKTYTVLNNGDAGFELEGHEGFSLNQETAKSLITRGTTLTTQSTVAENCQDLAAYGLDDPAATMKFDYTDGTSITLELGDKSPLTYYYLKLAGDNTVYTVYPSVATTMMTTLEALHTVELPGTLDSTAFTYVKLERPEGSAATAPVNGDSSDSGALLSSLMGLDSSMGDGSELTVPELPVATEAPAATDAAAATDAPAASDAPAATDAAVDTAAVETEAVSAEAPATTVIEITTRAEDDSSLGISAFKMVQPFEYDVDSEALTKLAQNVSAITIDSYVGNVSEPDNPYGMDNPIRITARDSNEVEITFLIGNKADESNTYVSVDDTGDVYLTKSSLVEFARNLTVAGVVDRFANIINITKVDALDVTTPDGSYELKIDRIPELDEEGNPKLDDNGKEIVNEVYYFGGEETDGDAFKKLYQEVIGILVNGITDDYDMTGEPVVTVKYHLNVEPGEITIEYIELDRDTYAVRREGKTYFYVNKSKINDMMTALAQYQ